MAVRRKAFFQHIHRENYRSVDTRASAVGQIVCIVYQTGRNKDSVADIQSIGVVFHLKIQFSLFQIKQLCLGMAVEIQGAVLTLGKYGPMKGEGAGRSAMDNVFKGQCIGRRILYHVASFLHGIVRNQWKIHFHHRILSKIIQVFGIKMQELGVKN